MATEPPVEPPLFQDEEGGGPVKPFLDHLEDLRWTIIRCIAALLVGMVVCLLGSKYIVMALEKPLHDAAKVYLGTNQLIKATVGQTSFTFKPGTNVAWKVLTGTNQFSKFRVEPALVDDQVFWKAVPEKFADNEVPSLVALKNFTVFSGFSIMMKLSLFGGFGVASPFIFFFIAQFIVPALRNRERDFLVKGAAFGSVLFITGVVFCYWRIIPVTMAAAVGISEYLGFDANEWRADEYIGFAIKFMLAMGLCFQLPVLLLTLVKIGILDYKKLSHYRMHWVIANLILSAVITPSQDPITLMFVAGPMHVLYELSILIAWFWYRRDKKEEAKKLTA